MYEVIGLEDFGTWCVKDKVMVINNTLAESLSRRGVLRIVKFVGDYKPYSAYFLESEIPILQSRINYLQEKLSFYKQRFKEIK